ncbi:MAG: exopolysaccharide biosynthesis polyprenyl glycosylphosphotransferase [Bacteroidales bacterium]|nr:exopolysaccharide biosynthesis polyprenyl glycosylphosphotransferase [Bacteroidales bacterium]
MSEFNHNLLMRSMKAFNALLLDIPFAICWWCYFADKMEVPYFFFGNLVVISLFIIFYYSFGNIYDAFKISMNSVPQMIYSQYLAIMMSDGVLYIVMWLLLKHLPNIWICLITMFAQFVLSALWCMITHTWYYRRYSAKRTAIVYDSRDGLDDMLGESELSKKFSLDWTKRVEEVMDDLSSLDNLDVLFISGGHSHQRNIILKYCIEHKVDMYVIPRLGDVIMHGARPAHLFHLPMMHVGRYNPEADYLFFKRAFDIISAGLVALIISPILLITAIAIKLQDGGPVFYKQKRLTKDGKVFDVLKFRSMRVDAEKDGVARLSTGDKDDRITPVGRFIRKVRIDELPQLFNIIGGSMSVVGPRPKRPEIAEQYLEFLPEFNLRLQAKAGLTGYAQVYGKYNTTPYDKLNMDLMYIANPSILEDLRIIFATIKILFLPESTEGIEEGKTTAQ